MQFDTAAREAQDHPAVDWMVRVGFAAYGVVYLVLAWLTVHVALGDRDGQVSREGAFHQIAQQPLGQVALWAACVGFAALVVWELLEVVIGHRDQEGLRRWAGHASSAVRALVFAAFAITAAQVATGDGGGGSGTDGYTARLMRLPFGPALVAAVGLGIIAYACFSAYKGISDKWREELDVEGRTGQVGRALTVLARLGYVARGVAFAVVGGLFVWAAFTHDAKKSGGLDQALVKVSQAPFGEVLLGVVALGFACYGLFNIAKVKHFA